MAKANFKRVTSPRGEALYPYLKAPEVYEGEEVGYTIQVKFSKEDTDKVLAILEEELESAKNSSEFKGKRWSKEPRMGFREDQNGDIVFKFKTKATIKTKAGDIVKRTVPVFDAKGKPVDVTIGNGSVVRVAFQIVPYWKSSTNNGLSLYLDAVQVIELVEYKGGGNASSFGFGEEDGFVGSDATPFDDEEDAVTPGDVGDEEF
ncbi:DUF2815 family protein [Propionispora hippei]|uniref:Single-stranded DNA-binding protein BPT7 domain-containing protein n=1 Tax=Propionispora hippei DSM 15287 TaxID=1123003 RepID=A0A1M6MER2_9FIRM|nr:DUF2815 family protein [Propionispora hippei]SHJ81927.1 Protein of unknown function [Propionispora hippei DSM 15287]